MSRPLRKRCPLCGFRESDDHIRLKLCRRTYGWFNSRALLSKQSSGRRNPRP